MYKYKDYDLGAALIKLEEARDLLQRYGISRGSLASWIRCLLSDKQRESMSNKKGLAFFGQATYTIEYINPVQGRNGEGDV